jgi:hypothetical protein
LFPFSKIDHAGPVVADEPVVEQVVEGESSTQDGTIIDFNEAETDK